MRSGWRLAATIGGLILLASACTGPSGNNNLASVSPASSPSSSPTQAPVVTSPSPSPAAEPTASTLAVAGLPVHNGEVGVGYLAVTLKATGGVAPYVWSVSSGTLPPGLSLSSAGVITGKNTTAGQYSFGVKVSDSSGQTDTGSTAIKVFAPFSVSQPCSQICAVGVDCVSCGRFGTMTGGAGPYTYKVTAGAIPAGMSRNGLTLNGPFPAMNLGSGVPVDVVVKGPLFLPYTLTVQVTDGFGVSRSVKANWYVFNPIDFVQPVSGGAPYAGCYSGPAPGTCQNTDLQYTLGSPYDNVAVKVTKVCYYDSQQVLQCPTDAAGIAAALPPGWYATAKSGTVTVGMDCGTACSNWYGDVYIVLVDKANCVSPGNVISGSEADVNIDI